MSFTFREKIHVKTKPLPTDIKINTSINPKMNQYFEFQISDKGADAEQSTVPFIDTQKVEPSPHVPLAGAGLYHKGDEYSGGFLGIKLITANISPHIKEILKNLKLLTEQRNAKINTVRLPINGRYYECLNNTARDTENYVTNN